MILQALCEYYERKNSIEPTTLPPCGFQDIEIQYIIYIKNDGSFDHIENRWNSDGHSAKKYRVIRDNGRTSADKPNILWDTLEYVLGFNQKTKSKNDSKSIKRFKLFKQEVDNLCERFPENQEFKALQLFYSKGVEVVYNDNEWNTIENHNKSTLYVSFCIIGHTTIIACNNDLRIIAKELNEEGLSTKKMRCLITGDLVHCVMMVAGTGIMGKKSRTKLISFKSGHGFDSYNKENGENAPISKIAESKFTSALEYLYANNSRNKFFLGDRAFAFWTIQKDRKSANSTFEIFFSSIFCTSVTDNPDQNIESIIKALKSPYTGILSDSAEDKFHILGLSEPSKGRLSVRLWEEGTVAELSHNIFQHFEDLRIVKSEIEMGKPDALLSLLFSVTFKGSNIQQNLPEALMKSILQGTPYPVSLVQACQRRIKAEQTVTSRRAAILKAYINRRTRIYNINNTKQLTMALDKENSNQGYLCGRLFAVLDKIQDEGMKARTIKERFMTAAAATPSTVFSRILSLSNHHLEKIENKGRAVNFEKLKGEIIDKFSCDGIPARLSLDDQCRFFVGYYHQLQDFYTKSEDK